MGPSVRMANALVSLLPRKDAFLKAFSFLVGLLCLVSVGSASAQVVPKMHQIDVEVTNNSNSCAWVTVYWGRFHTPWVIEKGPEGRPRSVAPHHTNRFVVPFTEVGPIPLPAEIKVRSEFWAGAACSGRQVADRSAENKGIVLKGILSHVELPAKLYGPPDTGYTVRLEQPHPLPLNP